VETRDAYQQQNMGRMQSRLDELERRGNLRWTTTENTFAALYAARTSLKPKGEDR